jgi:crossover junction endodeoxyribonuclease RusA
MKIVLPYPPSANRYWRSYRDKVVRSDEAIAYWKEVDYLCREADLTPCDGELVINLDLYRPRKRGDLDNHIKVVLDALQSWAYTNDDQVVEIHAYRHDDKDNPRVEVEVLEIEE